MSHQNLIDEVCDFIPKYDLESEDETEEPQSRENPAPLWHVASYKEGKRNYYEAIECIEAKVGGIPEGNIKRYGKSILIKAESQSQACILKNYIPSSTGNIEKITVYKSFNTTVGVVYSKDLFALSEAKILKLCPKNVCNVKKMNGTNHAILITFLSRYLPDYLGIKHDHIRVRKYKQRPRQCFRCFNFGHVSKYCQNRYRCPKCSEESHL